MDPKGNTGYLCVLRWPGEEAVVPLVKTRVKSARLLGDSSRLKLAQETNGRLMIQGLPKRPPHPAASVIKVEFDGEPESLRERDKSAWLKGKAR